MLIINDIPIGKGSEREVYLHPNDETKLIKISVNKSKRFSQHRRERRYFRQLQDRGIDWTYLSRYYGLVETNLGQGLVVERIRDHDGETSKPLFYYTGIDGIEKYRKALQKFRQYLLSQSIMVNDLNPHNLLVQKVDERRFRLVLVDGFGDHAKITLLNIFDFHVKSKIRRRWARTEKLWGWAQ